MTPSLISSVKRSIKNHHHHPSPLNKSHIHLFPPIYEIEKWRGPKCGYFLCPRNYLDNTVPLLISEAICSKEILKRDCFRNLMKIDFLNNKVCGKAFITYYLRVYRTIWRNLELIFGFYPIFVIQLWVFHTTHRLNK